MKYADIDWNRLWQEERRHKSWRRKKKQDWDRRATSFAKRNHASDFSAEFLALMQPQAGSSVLDVGCGPGTLALPLARQGLRVTAMDFSEQMLAELDSRAFQAGIETIKTVQASWTDDWHRLGLARHDVVLAARSLAVDDLRGALKKMIQWAATEVIVVDRVGPGPFDPDLFAALGRAFEPGPDFVFTVNILLQMGVTPRLDYLEFDQQRRYADREEALAGCSWMVDEVTKTEQRQLADYVDARLSDNADGTVTLTRAKPVKWAVIRWQINE